MIRFMLDSDNLSDLDPVAELLMTYSDLVSDPASLQKKLAPSKLILIDRGLGDPSGTASVFDIERGTLTIAQAVTEYDRKKSAGIEYLTVYGNRSNIGAIDEAFGNRKPWRIIATLDGTSHIAGIRALHGPAAIQCLGADALGIHADGSLVFEDAWHPQATLTLPTALLSRINKARADVRDASSELAQAAVLIGG